jgi:hypothetical protein
VGTRKISFVELLEYMEKRVPPLRDIKKVFSTETGAGKIFTTLPDSLLMTLEQLLATSQTAGQLGGQCLIPEKSPAEP